MNRGSTEPACFVNEERLQEAPNAHADWEPEMDAKQSEFKLQRGSLQDAANSSTQEAGEVTAEEPLRSERKLQEMEASSAYQACLDMGMASWQQQQPKAEAEGAREFAITEAKSLAERTATQLQAALTGAYASNTEAEDVDAVKVSSASVAACRKEVEEKKLVVAAKTPTKELAIAPTTPAKELEEKDLPETMRLAETTTKVLFTMENAAHWSFNEAREEASEQTLQAEHEFKEMVEGIAVPQDRLEENLSSMQKQQPQADEMRIQQDAFVIELEQSAQDVKATAEDAMGSQLDFKSRDFVEAESLAHSTTKQLQDVKAAIAGLQDTKQEARERPLQLERNLKEREEATAASDSYLEESTASAQEEHRKAEAHCTDDAACLSKLQQQAEDMKTEDEVAAWALASASQLELKKRELAIAAAESGTWSLAMSTANQRQVWPGANASHEKAEMSANDLVSVKVAVDGSAKVIHEASTKKTAKLEAKLKEVGESVAISRSQVGERVLQEQQQLADQKCLKRVARVNELEQHIEEMKEKTDAAWAMAASQFEFKSQALTIAESESMVEMDRWHMFDMSASTEADEKKEHSELENRFREVRCSGFSRKAKVHTALQALATSKLELQEDEHAIAEAVSLAESTAKQLPDVHAAADAIIKEADKKMPRLDMDSWEAEEAATASKANFENNTGCLQDQQQSVQEQVNNSILKKTQELVEEKDAKAAKLAHVMVAPQDQLHEKKLPMSEAGRLADMFDSKTVVAKVAAHANLKVIKESAADRVAQIERTIEASVASSESRLEEGVSALQEQQQQQQAAEEHLEEAAHLSWLGLQEDMNAEDEVAAQALAASHLELKSRERAAVETEEAAVDTKVKRRKLEAGSCLLFEEMAAAEMNTAEHPGQSAHEAILANDAITLKVPKVDPEDALDEVSAADQAMPVENPCGLGDQVRFEDELSGMRRFMQDDTDAVIDGLRDLLAIPDETRSEGRSAETIPVEQLNAGHVSDMQEDVVASGDSIDSAATTVHGIDADAPISVTDDNAYGGVSSSSSNPEAGAGQQIEARCVPEQARVEESCEKPGGGLSNPVVNLEVCDVQRRAVIQVKIRAKKPLQRLIDASVRVWELENVDEFTFVAPGGRQIQGKDTAESLGLCEGAVIEVHSARSNAVVPVTKEDVGTLAVESQTRQSWQSQCSYKRVVPGTLFGKRPVYRGFVKCNGKKIYIGTFNTEEEADGAVMKAESEISEGTWSGPALKKSQKRTFSASKGKPNADITWEKYRDSRMLLLRAQLEERWASLAQDEQALDLLDYRFGRCASTALPAATSGRLRKEIDALIAQRACTLEADGGTGVGDAAADSASSSGVMAPNKVADDDDDLLAGSPLTSALIARLALNTASLPSPLLIFLEICRASGPLSEAEVQQALLRFFDLDEVHRKALWSVVAHRAHLQDQAISAMLAQHGGAQKKASEVIGNLSGAANCGFAGFLQDNFKDIGSEHSSPSLAHGASSPRKLIEAQRHFFDLKDEELAEWCCGTAWPWQPSSRAASG